MPGDLRADLDELPAEYFQLPVLHELRPGQWRLKIGDETNQEWLDRANGELAEMMNEA